MADESISRKLSELFELFQSGALTKDEYESLKSKIINQDESVPGAVKKPADEQVTSKDSEAKASISETQSPIPEREVNASTSGNQPPYEEVTASLPGNQPPVQEDKAKASPAVKTSPSPDVDVKSGKKLVFIILIAFIVICSAVLAIVILKPGAAGRGSDKKNKLTEVQVTDADGNSYHTVTIGTQTWMTENLRTTKYNDGSAITLVTDSASWAKLATPAYCWYNNDEIANKNAYGALYNWYAIETNKLCPAGWHVPTNEEWTNLEDYLTANGYGYDGSGNDIAKSIAVASGWLASDTAGNVGNDQATNNKSGFSASQGGYRFSYGSFLYLGSYGKWWSSTESSNNSAFIRFIYSESSIVNSYANQKRNGFSVRCLKDSEVTGAKGVAENSIIEQSTSDVWDEAYAKELIMQELANHKDWSYISYRDSTTLVHTVHFSPTIKFDNKEFIIGIAYSDYEDNYCPDCHGVVSIFEFVNRGGWKLVNKALGFTDSKSGSNIGWYKISDDNYAISIRTIYGTMGEINEDIALYAFLNGKISHILGFDHMGNVEEYYTYEIKRSEKYNEAGYSYLLVEEKEKTEETDTILTKTVYAFNGREYEEFRGAITDPSLTSISRFYDINTAKERDNNVCPTCHGTGVQICNLCGGTGVNNMGMECGCIRAYNMEIAAGHTPSHPPRQWTCTSCRGTGNYSR